MSFVIAAPEMMAAAATDLGNIGSTIGAANSAAAAETTGMLAAGGDEVSAGIATLFSGYGQTYQALSTQAATFHSQFVQVLNSGAASYVSAEAANASPMQQALAAVNAPAESVLGRPLIGNGANGGPGQNGQPGGILFGNGGNGGASNTAGTAGGSGGSAGLIGNGGSGGAGFAGSAGGNGGTGSCPR